MNILDELKTLYDYCDKQRRSSEEKVYKLVVNQCYADCMAEIYKLIIRLEANDKEIKQDFLEKMKAFDPTKWTPDTFIG